MGFKLPPLSSVRVFEVAARHGSFKKAAEELNITASAVEPRRAESWKIGSALRCFSAAAATSDRLSPAPPMRSRSAKR